MCVCVTLFVNFYIGFIGFSSILSFAVFVVFTISSRFNFDCSLYAEVLYATINFDFVLRS